MKRFAITIIVVAATLCSSCSKAPEPVVKQKVQAESVRERAERVGAVGDATVTRNLKKNLTGIIDKNAEHAIELEEAAGK